MVIYLVLISCGPDVLPSSSCQGLPEKGARKKTKKINEVRDMGKWMLWIWLFSVDLLVWKQLTTQWDDFASGYCWRMLILLMSAQHYFLTPRWTIQLYKLHTFFNSVSIDRSLFLYVTDLPLKIWSHFLKRCVSDRSRPLIGWAGWPAWLLRFPAHLVVVGKQERCLTSILVCYRM